MSAFLIEIAICSPIAADLTTRTVGAIEQANQTKLSFAVWHLQDYELISKAI